jgi:pimeloyl-ACP methyl ester carboxylesterase
MSELPAATFVDLDVPVATYAVGPEDGRAQGDVVLCHGTPWSARVWARVAHLLARGWGVHLWDMPGFGASVPGTSRGESAAVDLVAQRRRLSALLDRLGLDRPHLVGHDIGGAVVLGAHLLEGVGAASITLLDIVTLDPWGSPFFRLVADHEEVFAALPPALHRALVREYVAGAGGPGLDPDLPAELARPWEGAEGQAAFYRQVAALRPEHTRPIVRRLGDVRAPVAIGWGEADPWIPVEQAGELARRLPGGPAVTLLPGVGHLAPLEAADAVADVISGHLATL